MDQALLDPQANKLEVQLDVKLFLALGCALASPSNRRDPNTNRIRAQLQWLRVDPHQPIF